MNPLTISTLPSQRHTPLLDVAAAAIVLSIVVLQDLPQPLWGWLVLAAAYLVIEAQATRPGGSGWIAGVAMGAVLAPQGALTAVLLAAVASEVVRGRGASVAALAARIVGQVPPVAAFLVVAGTSPTTATLVVAGGIAGAISYGTTGLADRWAGAIAPDRDEGPRVAVEAIGLGAVAALLGAVARTVPWPIAPVVAVGLVIVASVATGRRRLEDAERATVRTLLATIEAKDLYTRGHSERVAVYAEWLGAELGMRPRQLHTLRTAALLHDVGKLIVPRRILRKPGTLTDDERVHVARHVTIVPELLDGIAAVAPAVPIVACHHLHFGGGGYGGERLSGYALPIEARILAVADAFDAMTTHRPYRRALSVDYAVMELQRCAGTQFDPHVVAAFVRTLEGRRLPTPAEGYPSEEAARLEAERIPVHV